MLASLILFRMYAEDTAAKHKSRLEGDLVHMIRLKKVGQGRFCVEVVTKSLLVRYGVA